MRALLLASLLVAPVVLAGCLGGGDPAAGLAKPTDAVVLPPIPTAPTRAPTVFNASDPGYALTARWHVGDGWDWESNASPARYRTVRVVEERVVNGTPFYRVEETFGIVGNRADARGTQWVDGGRWGIVNATDTAGGYVEYTPPQPLRFFRNATFGYRETGVDPFSGSVYQNRWVHASFVEPQWEVVRLPWGNVAAFKVIHDRAVGNTTAPRLVMWGSPLYANLVQYEAEDVRWKLVAAREGGREMGVLQPTG